MTFASSQAVVANGFVFTAGQIPAISGLDHQPDTFEDQVRQTILNLRSVLEAAGSGLEHVVKVNAYLTVPCWSCTPARYWSWTCPVTTGTRRWAPSPRRRPLRKAPQALVSDAAEPALLARIASGEPLESVMAI
ncbi:RidA family protein [Pseudarthrobacter sp. O4]|uniref:RidA family protein n=1 Tax=Pseudarthrobacter sp. O4 TaxID=3418417 RepID=UPI003CE76C33